MKARYFLLSILIVIYFSCTNNESLSGEWEGVLSHLEFKKNNTLVINMYGNKTVEYKQINKSTYYSENAEDTLLINQLSNDTLKIYYQDRPEYIFTHSKMVSKQDSISTQDILKFLKSDTLEISFKSSYPSGYLAFNDTSFLWLENDKYYGWRLNNFNNKVYLELENDFRKIYNMIVRFDSDKLVLRSYDFDEKKEIISYIKRK